MAYLLEFSAMTKTEMHRMVRSVYGEAIRENALERDPVAGATQALIQAEEDRFVDFLCQFFRGYRSSYYVLCDNDRWVSALRLTQLSGFYYLEALETAPEERRKGHATHLMQLMLRRLKKHSTGQVVIRSCINKKNAASLAVHTKYGFVIETEHGYNPLYHTTNNNNYGMIYMEGEHDE